MPLPPASERGVTRQTEIVLAKNIDIDVIAERTNGEIWASKSGRMPQYLPDRIEFPQEGVVFKPGRPKGPILEYTQQPPKKRFRRTSRPETKRFVVDAVVFDNNDGSTTFVHRDTDEKDYTRGLTTVRVSPLGGTLVSNIPYGNLSPMDEKILTAICAQRGTGKTAERRNS